MGLQGWFTIAIFALYFLYTSYESSRRYKEQKQIQKEENEKTRQAYKQALKDVLKEIQNEN